MMAWVEIFGCRRGRLLSRLGLLASGPMPANRILESLIDDALGQFIALDVVRTFFNGATNVLDLFHSDIRQSRNRRAEFANLARR